MVGTNEVQLDVIMSCNLMQECVLLEYQYFDRTHGSGDAMRLCQGANPQNQSRFMDRAR